MVELVMPLMREVVETARVKGFELGREEVVEFMINVDPEGTFFRSSTLQDIEKACPLSQCFPSYLLLLFSNGGIFF
jgi:ketopantoate reductase